MKINITIELNDSIQTLHDVGVAIANATNTYTDASEKLTVQDNGWLTVDGQRIGKYNIPLGYVDTTNPLQYSIYSERQLPGGDCYDAEKYQAWLAIQ